MGRQSDIRRLIRDARDGVAQGQREIIARGFAPPAPLQSAHDKLGEATDLLRDALSDAAKTGKVEP